MKELTFFIAGFLLAKYLSKGKTITLIDNSNGYQNNRGNYKTTIVSDKPIIANEIKNNKGELTLNITGKFDSDYKKIGKVPTIF